MELVLWILLGVIVVILPCFFMLRYTMKISRDLFLDLFVRTEKTKWSRECSAPEIEEHYGMYKDGVEWACTVMSNMRELTVENDGLKLYGEYYDFGYDKAVIIIPGRNEGLRYSYYFAMPYPKAGYNVLVIDIRAHGNSEGKYDTLGWDEKGDMIKWIELLSENGVKKVILHGLCIGAATSIYTAAAENCPKELAALILEGPYTSFYDILKQRMKTQKKPVFPVRNELRYIIKKNYGYDIKKQSPLNFADKVKIPTLFICGRRDVSSVPEKCEMLYKSIGSQKKKLVWFSRGAHSHLRVNNLPYYDREIIDFLGSCGI